MDERRPPALPFLDMSRKDISRRKKSDDKERMLEAQRIRERKDQEPVPETSGGTQHQETSVLETANDDGHNKADMSSVVKPEPASPTGRHVNFGRAAGIRAMEQTAREQREHMPTFGKSLKDVFGIPDSQMFHDGPIIPKRRNITEILARPTLPDPKNAHASRVKWSRAQVAKPAMKAEKELKLLYTRVGIHPRHEVQSATEVVPLLVPPTPSEDAMPSGGWTATQGSVVPLCKIEGIYEPSNGNRVEFQDSEVRTATIDNRTEIRIAQLSGRPYFNFASRPRFTDHRVDEICPLTRDSMRWLRLQILTSDFPVEPVFVPAGDGDVGHARSMQAMGYFPNSLQHPSPSSGTVTVQSIGMPGEEEMAESRAGLRMPVATQTHIPEISSSGSQTELQPSLWDQKWTQMPARIDMTSVDLENSSSIYLLNAQCKGVGSDPEYESVRNLDLRVCPPRVDLMKDAVADENQNSSLGEFMEGAVKTMLTALEGKRVGGSDMKGEDQSSSIHGSLSFDMKMSKQETFFTTKVVCDGRHVACVRAEKPNEKTGKTASGYSTISIWKADFPDIVLHEFRVWGSVDALDMCISVGLLVAGSDNGALSFFSLHDSESLLERPDGNPFQTASVYTGSLDEPHHYTGVKAVQILQETDFSAQIISMDDEVIICWNCIHSIALDKSDQVGHHNAPWTSLRVRMIQQIDIAKELNHSGFRGVSLKVWQNDETHFIVGGNYGFTAKGTICPPEVRSTYYVHYFHKSDVSLCVRVPSLDINCSRELYAACGADNVHLIYLNRNNVICTLKCEQRPMKIRWSRTRACLLYVCLPNQVSVYDLLQNNLLPIATFPFKAMVDFDILTHGRKEYLAIVFKRGKRFHLESLQFTTLPLTSAENHKFQSFISICN